MCSPVRAGLEMGCAWGVELRSVEHFNSLTHADTRSMQKLLVRLLGQKRKKEKAVEGEVS